MSIFDDENMEENMRAVIIPNESEYAKCQALYIAVRCKHCGNIANIPISLDDVNKSYIWVRKAWDVCYHCNNHYDDKGKPSAYIYTDVLARHPDLNHG